MVIEECLKVLEGWAQSIDLPEGLIHGDADGVRKIQGSDPGIVHGYPDQGIGMAIQDPVRKSRRLLSED